MSCNFLAVVGVAPVIKKAVRNSTRGKFSVSTVVTATTASRHVSVILQRLDHMLSPRWEQIYVVYVCYGTMARKLFGAASSIFGLQVDLALMSELATN